MATRFVRKRYHVKNVHFPPAITGAACYLAGRNTLLTNFFERLQVEKCASAVAKVQVSLTRTSAQKSILSNVLFELRESAFFMYFSRQTRSARAKVLTFKGKYLEIDEEKIVRICFTIFAMWNCFTIFDVVSRLQYPAACSSKTIRRLQLR